MRRGPVVPLIDTQIRRVDIALLVLGVLAATGFQPLGLWPLALLAAGLATLLIARAHSWKQAALYGWLFGMGYFTFGNNWIATAFTYQSNMPALLGWFAVPLLSLLLALFPAFAGGSAHILAGKLGKSAPSPQFSPRLPLGFALLFAGCWIISEWLRSWVLTGYSWNPFAMVLLGPFDRPGLALVTPFMGTYAASGIAILLGCALVHAIGARRWLALGVGVAALAGAMYLPRPAAQDSALQASVVQPNIDQSRLHRPELYEDNFRRLADNSLATQPGARRIVLWPESGMADYLQEGYPQAYYNSTTAFGSPSIARRRLGNVVGENSLLLTGAVDLEFPEREADEFARAIGARNAVSIINQSGELVGSYYKAHLVPFGEYLPLRGLLEPLGLSRLVPGSFDFWPGPGPRTLDLGDHGKAGVQICYEIIFSGQVTQKGTRPDYIFNPSNDGWYGRFGPPQHLAQARMRAIEEGLPVLRSTTTGISAIIDARGVVREHLGMHQLGRMDRAVPAALPPTWFAQMGNLLAICWAVLFCALGLVALRRMGR